MSHNCLLGNCWVLVSCFHPRFPLYCRGCQVRQVNRSSLQELHSSPVVTQLCLSWCFISHLSWLHPLGVAASEKLPWEQEEHEDFLRVGCHILAPGSIRSGGVTAACTQTRAIIIPLEQHTAEAFENSYICTLQYFCWNTIMLITSDLLMLDSCKSKEKAHKQKHLRYYDNREEWSHRVWLH